MPTVPTSGLVVVRSGIGHFEGQLRSQGASRPTGSGVTGGWLHYDTANERFAFYDGTDWRSSVVVSGTAPSSPELGRLWLDTSASGTGGSSFLSITTITSSATLTTSHTVVLCDATSGAITVTLPAAADSKGKRYFIKKIDSSANAVTVDGNASETIDGSTTGTLSSQYDSIEIVCDGSNWHII